MTSPWIIATALLLTSAAHAYPTIGDKVTWSGTIPNSIGGTSEITITKEIVSFDKDSKKWKVKTDTAIGSEKSSETVELISLFTPDRYKEILKNCEKDGGKIEEIITHPGKYKTCKMTTTSSTGVITEKWWGDIPFGVVQNQSPIQSLITDL